jgi:hypothetical protein
VPPPQAPELQVLPAQHGWPLAPHAAHVSEAALHTWPALHQPPPVPGQQVSPGPPQPAHVVPWHAMNGAVHCTPPPQHGWPGPPHAPLPHEPLLHVPWPPPHAPPGETHARVVWSQHPPPPHQSPSQQG